MPNGINCVWRVFVAGLMTGAKKVGQKKSWPPLVHCVDASNNLVMQNANSKREMDGTGSTNNYFWNGTCQKPSARESMVIEVN